PRDLTQEEIKEAEQRAKERAEEAEKKQAAVRQANKARLAPSLYAPLEFEDGTPAFRSDVLAAKAVKQAQRAVDLQIKVAKEKRDAADFARANGIPLTIRQDGQLGAVERLSNGRLYYNVTYNAGSATLIQTDQLWPGGS